MPEDGARQRMEADLNGLTGLACGLGATDAGIISAKRIPVEDELAKLCLTPHKCESYGLSASCPPHVSGPAGFRRLQQNYDHALVFKIEVPSEILISHQHDDIFRLLNEIAASLEQEAIALGLADSCAFAGGCCKNLFCPDKPDCRKLTQGQCRNPLLARPSMSGFGINVSKLMQEAGWTMHRAKAGDPPGAMIPVCGLVLLG